MKSDVETIKCSCIKCLVGPIVKKTKNELLSRSFPQLGCLSIFLVYITPRFYEQQV